METHSATPDPDRAGELLADLEGDRTALAPHSATPGWFLAAAAALAGAYVAMPLLRDDRSPVLLVIGAGALGLVVQLQQRRLVRPRGSNAGAALTALGLIAVVLPLISVSFGLVAAGLEPLVALPVLLAGLGTHLVLRRADARARRDLDRVR